MREIERGGEREEEGEEERMEEQKDEAVKVENNFGKNILYE